ncbi:MAG TPA: DnaJ domain-containing protein [Blastocatellia bacterium]|nr:DnaJ domain-containing protein [Blastocatellia bacterium]
MKKKYEAGKDYYRILGVSQDATQEEIDRAFRAAARKRHPDGGGSEEEMKVLNEARDVLSDEETRKAYDAERRPRRASYGSSMAYDPDAASRAGTLKIPVSEGDFVGLAIGAAACFAFGIPFLLLIEMQWVFFLWPLRVLTLGAIVLGVVMAHSAMRIKQRQNHPSSSESFRYRHLLYEIAFWIIVIGVLGALLFQLYSG